MRVTNHKTQLFTLFRKELAISVLLFCLHFIGTGVGIQAQDLQKINIKEQDSASEVKFTAEQAATYLWRLIYSEPNRQWLTDPSLRTLVRRLLDHYEAPFDSVRMKLEQLPDEAFVMNSMQLVHIDTIPLRWLNESTFILDTIPLAREPLMYKQTITMKLADFTGLLPENVSQELRALLDTVFQTRDTVVEMVIDTAYLKSKMVETHQLKGMVVDPPLHFRNPNTDYVFLPDSSGLVVFWADRPLSDTARFLSAGTDSLRSAVGILLGHLNRRDSLLLQIGTNHARGIPFWVTSGRSDLYRFWMKNEQNDSISVWLGNPGLRTLTLQLEEGVNVQRPESLGASDLTIIQVQPVKKLAPVKPLGGAPFSWNHSFVGSVSLNQNHLSNWAKGGVSSFSTLVDLLAKTEYQNTKNKEQWISNARLRYGSIRTKENGYRTSNDILEFNSQYNRQQREKLDFSALLYFKTQIAYGYKYPNDSVVVSKFLNPASFTLGVGFEYRPVKGGSINVSPLSYKNTFVLDTANINPTTHGVDPDRRARQEFGGQVLVRHTISVLNGMAISNSLRLFSSYLNKPQNIDVDWELGIEKQINWYFTIRFDFHLIYDEDVKFAILDADGKPVKWPDGTPQKAPRTQINQFLGITLTFSI